MNSLLLFAAWVPALFQDQVLYELQQQNEGRCRMPTSFQSVLPSDTTIADSVMVGRPEMFQDPYRQVSERYPVTPMPRYSIPLEEQMARQEWQTQQLGRQTAINGQLLNQRITQKQLEYDNNIANQAEQAISRIGELNPSADDYEAQKAAFVKQFPLAVQNPAFNTMLGRLDQSYSQQRQASDILQRQGFEMDARQQFSEERQEQEILMDLAKYGPQAIAKYQENLKPDASGFVTPSARLQAYAAVQGLVQQERNKALEEKPMTPQQVQREIASKRQQRQRILQTAGARGPDELTGDMLDDYNAIGSEITSLQGNPSNTASPAPANTAPPSSFFPKPSTKTGP